MVDGGVFADRLQLNSLRSIASMHAVSVRQQDGRVVQLGRKRYKTFLPKLSEF